MSSLNARVLGISRRVSLSVASTLLLIDLAIILYGVFMRYLAGGAPIWTDELARYLIIGSVLLAAGAVWVEGGHMRVALIERLLPVTLRRLLNLYQWLLTLGIAIAAAIFSYRYAQQASAMECGQPCSNGRPYSVHTDEFKEQKERPRMVRADRQSRAPSNGQGKRRCPSAVGGPRAARAAPTRCHFRAPGARLC